MAYKRLQFIDPQNVMAIRHIEDELIRLGSQSSSVAGVTSGQVDQKISESKTNTLKEVDQKIATAKQQILEEVAQKYQTKA